MRITDRDWAKVIRNSIKCSFILLITSFPLKIHLLWVIRRWTAPLIKHRTRWIPTIINRICITNSIWILRTILKRSHQKRISWSQKMRLISITLMSITMELVALWIEDENYKRQLRMWVTVPITTQSLFKTPPPRSTSNRISLLTLRVWVGPSSIIWKPSYLRIVTTISMKDQPQIAHPYWSIIKTTASLETPAAP